MCGTATPDGVRLEVIGLRAVTERVPARRRKKAALSARKDASGKPAPCARCPASEDSSESSAESSDSDSEQMCALEEDVRGSSGGSSCPSVDTDAESGLDDLTVADDAADENADAGASDLDDADEADDENADQAGPGGPAHDRGHRHPSGTWVIWQNTWFYITKTPPYLDVKCNVKHALRNPAGLGQREMSKTLTLRSMERHGINLCVPSFCFGHGPRGGFEKMVSRQPALAAYERQSVKRSVCSLTFERPCRRREVWSFLFLGTTRPTVSLASGSPTLFSGSLDCAIYNHSEARSKTAPCIRCTA